MGFLNNAKVVSNTDTSNLKPLQGAKVILPNNTSTQPVEEKSALDTFGKIVDIISTPIDIWMKPLAEVLVDRFSKPDNIALNKAKEELQSVNVSKSSMTDEEYSNKLFSSFKNNIKLQTGAEDVVVDYQSLDFLKQLGLEPTTRKNKDGKEYTSFNDLNKQFTEEEKKKLYEETNNIALNYNKRIQEIQENKALVQESFQGGSRFVPILSTIKTEEQKNLEKLLNNQIEQLEEEKTLLISTIKDKIGSTKSEARQVNPETGIIATQPLEKIDFENISKIDPNEVRQIFGFANYDLEERNKGLNSVNNPTTTIDSLGKSLLFMDYVDKGLELVYGANPEVLKLKKEKLGDGHFKDNQKPAIEQQEAAFVAIKQEQRDLVSSVEQNEEYKKNIDNTLNSYLEKYKKGEKLTPDEQAIFNNISLISTNLEKNIKLQKDNLKNLQSFIDNTTPAYKGFLEEQFKYDKIAEIAPITTSIYEGIESIVSIPKRAALFTADIGQAAGVISSDLNTYLHLKTSPEFRYNVDGELKSIKEIEAIKLVDKEGNLFDEEGKPNFDVHVPALFYNTVKVSGESFVLGLGMLGTRALVASTIEKNLAKWATGEAASEIGISQVLPTNPLSTPFNQLGREFTKAALMGTGSEAAFLSPLYIAESFVGSAVPSALLFGDEMIQNQLQQGLPYNASVATGTLLSFVEGFSERMFPNEMNFAKFMVQKGEIKTLKELTENATYKKAIQETYKQITGKPLTEKVYKLLTNTKEFGKAFLTTGGEESLEELGGLFLQDKFVNPISRKYNPEYKGEEFTQEAIVNTTISTMATMLPMMGQAGYSAVKQYNTAQKSAQFIVGQNTAPYHEMNLVLFKEGAISEQEFQRRTQLIDKHKQNYNNALGQAITKAFTANYTEDQFKNYTFQLFDKLSSIENLKKAVVDNPNDEQVFQILEKENQNLQILLEKGLFNTEEKRVENVKNSLSFYLSSDNLNTFSKKQLESTIQKLQKYEQTELDEDLKTNYTQKIQELTSKLDEVNKKEIEEAKTAQEKAKEAEVKGNITVPTNKGDRIFQLGKKYVVNRQLNFKDPKNPIRFPEITFLGYKKDENGNIIEENGSPIVILETKNTKGQKVITERPTSVFKDYILTTEEAINSTPEGRFYNRYKSKKFELSLSYINKEGKKVPNRFFNKLKKSFGITEEDVLEGALSVENINGKIVLFFNFIAKDKKGNEKEGYIELTDRDIQSAEKYGQKSFIRPKTKSFTTTSGKTVYSQGQYENLSIEEIEDLVGLTEAEQLQYQQYLESQDFEDLKTRRLLQENRRRNLLQEYIKTISQPLTNVLEEIEKLTKKSEEYTSFLYTVSSIKNLLNIAKFSQITNEQIKTILPQTQHAKYLKLQNDYQRLSFLKDYLDKKVDEIYKKATSVSNKLADLEAKKEKYQEAIDEQIQFLDSIDVEELDYTTSITTQLKQKRKNLKELLEEKEKAFSSARTVIDNLLEAINTVKEVIENLFNSLQSFIDPNAAKESKELLNSELNSLNSELNSAETKLNTIAEERVQISSQIKKLNKLITYLSAIEKSFEQEMKDLDSQRLREFILQENSKQPQTDTETNTAEEDRRLEDKSTKKNLSTVFSSSTSWGYNYEEKLQESTNNYANARLDYFLNNQAKTGDVILLPITKKNASKYGLEGILTPGMENEDIQLVPVKIATDKTFVFLDMNGEAIEKPSPENVIYTPLPLINSLEDLKDSQGKLKYNLSELQNLKPEEQDKVLKSYVEQFKAFREQILSTDNPSTLTNVNISRGIPQYAGSTEESFVRNPIRGTLLPTTFTSFQGLLLIPTVPNTEGSKTSTVIDHTGNPVNVPLGRPILFNKSTNSFQSVDNHKLSASQKESVKNAIYNLALRTRENFKKASLDKVSSPILDVDIINYLRGVIYWRNPNRLVNNKKQDNIARNQMWVDYNENNELSLFYGQNGIYLTFKEIIESEGRHEALDIITNELFHNINASNLGKPFIEFYVENKQTKKRTWKSYEDYLLSDKNPDNTTRDINTIPLTTNVIPNSSPFDENNTFAPNYNPQYRSKYFTFKSPVSTPKIEEGTKETASSPKEPSKQPLNVQAVENSINDRINNEDNESGKNALRSAFDFWKSVAQNLKTGTFNISSSNPSTNDGEPFYSFTVSFKGDEIEISNINITINDAISQVFLNKGVKITEDNIKNVLNFLTYRNTEISDEGFVLLQIGRKFEYKPQETKTEDVKFSTKEELKDFVKDEKPSGKKIIKRPKTSNKPNSGYRIAKGKATQKINIEKARQWFNSKFSQLNFSVVSGLVDGIAWGKFVKNGVILSEAAEIGTEYHEAFEVVAGLFLNKREWNTLKREFKNRKGSYIDRETGKVTLYSEATNHQIKEELAEEYRTYELSGGKTRWEGEYKKNSLFRTIYNHIKALLFGDAKEINEVFERISNAYYKDKSPVNWNRPFNLDKSYKIANLQDDLFFKHLNQSLSYYTFVYVFKSGKNLSELFKADNNYFTNLYASVKKNIENQYIKIEDGNLIEDFGYNTLNDLLEDYDNFFDNLVETYQEGYSVPNSFSKIIDNLKSVSAEELYQISYNKFKDYLISLQYIQSNWKDIVDNHKNYLNKFKIGYEGEIEDVDIEEINEDEALTTEELKNSVGRDEYTKDPFSIFLKDSANKRIKFLIATLPKSVITGTVDEFNVPITQVVYNSLGLEEPSNFSKTFRKVVSTVIADNNIYEMLESIKNAIPNNPEFRNLYNRLGGNKTSDQLTEDEFELRIAFQQTFNKQRVEFSRLLLREIEVGRGKNKTYNLVSNLINSLKSSGTQSIINRYVQNLKSVALQKGWINEETQSIIIPREGIPADNKNINNNIKYLESIGFDFPYTVESLSSEELILVTEPINDILNFIRSNEAKLEELRYYNFSGYVKKLAEAEIEITKDSTETQHRNIDNQPQSNDISQNAFSSVWKSLNKLKTLPEFIKAFPRFNDIYTQNAFWRELYFTNGERNKVKYTLESAEGVVNIDNKGRHTSKLPLNLRFLQEFIYNIYNDKKGFRTPGFYFITPADIKTEFVNKWGRELVNRSVTQDTETFFDFVARGYLIDEINLARELSIDDRGLKAYRKTVSNEFIGERPISKSLRFFNDILKFDYTSVIDNQDIDIEEWIAFNKETIISNLNDFIENGVNEVFDKFKEEQITVEQQIGNNTYLDFYGLDEYLMNWIDGEFGTNLVNMNKRYNQTLFTEEKLRELIRYRNVNYFVNINEQSKLFLGDIGQYGDLTKRVKSFISTREHTVHDTPLTDSNVFTKLAKKFYNKVVFTDELGNTTEIELEPNTPGYQEFTNEFKATTIKDVEVIQTSISNIQDKHNQSLAQSLFFDSFENLPETIQKFITDKVSKITSAFAKVNEADAQAYMALPLYRQFLKRSTMWSDEKEELYQYHMAYERIKRNNYPNTEYGKSLKNIDEQIVDKGNPNTNRALKGLSPIDFPVLKPIGAGVRPGNKFITTLDKNSVAPLFYQALEGKPSLNTYLSAVDNGNQYFRFESAHKVGTPADIISPYNYEGESVTLPITDELSFEDFGIQVETSTLKNKVTRGTQALKIPLLNLFESGIPIDFVKSVQSEVQDLIQDLKNSFEDFNPSTYIEKWSDVNKQLITKAKELWNNLTEEEKLNISPVYKAAQDHNNIISILTERYFQEISEKFSIEKTSDDKIRIKDFSKFKEALHQQLKDREAANNLIAQIEVENGKMVQPFDFIVGADKLEPILFSIFNNNVAQPKMNGRALAQIASTFFENSPRKYVKKIKLPNNLFTYEEVENPDTYPNKGELILTSNELLFYGDYYVEDKNGNTKKATKQEIESGQAKQADFIEIYLPQIFKDKLGRFITDKGKIDSKLLEAVGYRIPTQEMSSMENIRIKGFLPLEFQNGVVVPSSITAKAGSDFDIDKLNIYLYHYTYSAKQDKVIKVPYLDNSNSTVEDRYVSFVKDHLKKFDEQLQDDEIALELKEQLFKNLGKIWDKTIREIFKNLPELTESSKQFQTVKQSLKTLSNKSLSKQLLDILYSKESNFDKYETISEIIEIEKEKQLFEEAQKLSALQQELDQLFQLSEIQADTIKWLKKTMKSSLGYASLKGQMKETKDEVLANYIFQYNIQIPSFPTYSDFLILNTEQQNTTKALENKYIESIQALLTLPENFTRLTNPNTADTLKDLADEIDKLKKITTVKEKFAQYLSPIKNALTRYSFQIGKEGVGIGAVGMTNEAINQIVDSYINDSSIYEISLILPTNETISFTRDKEGKFISDNISEFINAFVDVAKDPFIIRLNGNLSTAGSYIVANKIGIPLKNIALLMNQPIILEYEKLQEFTSSPIGRLRIKQQRDNSQKYINTQIKYKYGTQSEEYKPNILSISELEDMISSETLTEEQNQHQLALLETYKKIKDLSESLREAVSTYNYDTDQAKFITDVIAKKQREETYLKNPKVVIPTKNTFFEKIKQSTLDYTDALTPLFQSFSAKYYPYVYKIQQRIALINDTNQRQRALAEIKKGLANFLLLTYNNSQIQNQISNILLSDNILKEIKALKARMEKGEIEENFAISELFPLPADKINKKTFNLTLFNKESSGEYIDLIANSLKQLESIPEYSLLAKKIYTLALLQSGLTTSFISLSQFIPHETFTKLAKEVIANPNTSLLPYFEQMFYANKWKDNKFTLNSPRRPEIDENISSQPIIQLSGVYMDETGKPQLNKRNFAYFQIASYSLEETDKLSKKWKTRIFQRVEDNEGNPILIQSNDSYNFIYREVTPLGDGQNALEYSLQSKINDNIPSESQQTIIANIQSNFPNTSFTLSEILEEKPKTTPTTELTSQQYSQYLEQNPDGSVEQFKSWVDEFKKDEQNLYSNLDVFSIGEFSEQDAIDIINEAFSKINSDEEAKKLYRSFAIKYHPDKKGSEVVMQHLNNVIDDYRKNKVKPKVNNTTNSNTHSRWQDSESEFDKKIKDKIKKYSSMHYDGTWTYKNVEKLTADDIIYAINNSTGSGYFDESFTLATYLRFAEDNPNLFDKDQKELLNVIRNNPATFNALYNNGLGNLKYIKIKWNDNLLNPLNKTVGGRIGISPRYEQLFLNGTNKEVIISDIYLNPDLFTEISIKQNFGTQTFKIFTDTIGHELLHKLTIGEILKGGVFRDNINTLYKIAYEYYQKNPTDNHTINYGMKDLAEFTAEFFSSSDFRNYLSKIKTKEDLNKSLLDKIISTIIRLFNSNYNMKDTTIKELLQRTLNYQLNSPLNESLITDKNSVVLSKANFDYKPNFNSDIVRQELKPKDVEVKPEITEEDINNLPSCI